MTTTARQVSNCKCNLRHELLDKNIDLQIKVIKTRLDGMDKAIALQAQELASRIQAKIYIIGVVVGAALVLLEILMNLITRK